MHAPRSVAFAAALAFLCSAGSALADEVRFEADFTGASLVPAVETAAEGTLEAVLDTDRRTITWLMRYAGLSGPVTAIRFHGPAPAGENGAEIATITGNILNPVHGGRSVGGATVDAMMEGLVYIIIATGAHPDGELRAQMELTEVYGGAGEE